MTFEIGDTVQVARSRYEPSRLDAPFYHGDVANRAKPRDFPAFVGKVVERFSGKHGTVYNVEDAAGMVWHRNPGELSLVKQ